jgi:uncharacterized protein (TIGR03437 family)
MSAVSFDGSLYTYSARVNVLITTSSFAESGFYGGIVLFSLGTSSMSIPLAVTVTKTPGGITPVVTGIVNAAAAVQAMNGVLSPGSYISIYGSNLAGADSANATTLPLPKTLNGASLGSMPLLYASANQINALYPLNATTLTSGWTSPAGSITPHYSVVELQPGVYTQDTSGSGPGVIANAFTGQLIDKSHPAHASDYIVVYCTGLGPVTGPNKEPAPVDGTAAPLTTIYHTTAQVTANIGGVPAPVVFAGLTPGFAALYQVNIQIPPGAGSGAVTLVLKEENLADGFIANSNPVTVQLQ